MARLLIAYVFLGFGHFAVSGQSPTADSLYNTGLSALASMDYDRAIDCFEACRQIASGNDRCLAQLGMASFRAGQFGRSKACWLALAEDNAWQEDAWRHLAQIFEIEQHAPKAVKYYTRLIERFPDHALYLRKKAKLLSDAGSVADAIRLYARAYAVNPRDFYVVRGLSELLIEQGQFATADTILSTYLAHDAENVGALLLAGKNKYKRRQYDSTAHYLSLATHQIDLNNYYNKMYGYALLQIDSIEGAIFHLERSLVNERNPEYAHYYLGNAYEKKEDVHAARFHYQKALEAGISENMHRYHLHLARIFENAEDEKAAIHHYEEAWTHTQDPILLYHLARLSDAYYRDKNIAISHYRRYIRSAHAQPEYQQYARARLQYLREQAHQSSR